MELRQLEVFVAVAEAASFSRAADRLHVVQSAVSSSIRTLERELGSRLLDRTTRAVALTDAGAALLPEARATLRAAALARDAVEQTKGGLRGSVVLGIMQAWAHPTLSVPELIGIFQRDHPHVDLSVRHVGGSAVLAEAVRDGTVDLGILSLPGPGPGLELHELSVEPMAFACTAAHPLARASSVTLPEIADETFVDAPPGWGTRQAADLAFARAGIARRVRFEVNEMTTIIEFVRSGVAVTLLPPSIGDGRGEIVSVPIGGDPIVFRALLAVPSERRLSAAAQAVAETIRRTAPAA